MNLGMCSTFETYRSVSIGGTCLILTLLEKGISWDDLTADTAVSTLGSNLTTTTPQDRLLYRQRILSIMDELHRTSSRKAVISLSSSITEAESCRMQASLLVSTLVEWVALNYSSSLSLQIMLECSSPGSDSALEREFIKWVRAEDVHRMWLSQLSVLFPDSHSTSANAARPMYMWWYEDKQGNKVPYHYDQVMEIEKTFLHIKSIDVLLLPKHPTRSTQQASKQRSPDSESTDTDAFDQIVYMEDETNQFKHTSMASADCLPVHRAPFDPSAHHMPGFSRHMSAFSVKLHRNFLDPKGVVDADHLAASYTSH